MNKLNVDRINLCPSQPRALSRTHGLIAGLVCLYLLAIWSAYHQFRSRTEKSEEIASLTSARDALKTRLVVFEKQKGSKDIKIGATLNAFVNAKAHWAAPMKELSLLTPEHLWLTTMSGELNNGALKVTISGDALDANLITDFSVAIERSFYFRDVKLKFSERDESVTPAIYHFQFECAVSKTRYGEG